MDLKEEVVLLASEPEANIAAIARKFGVQRKTVYFWLERFRRVGRELLAERSHRPRRLRGISGEMVLRLLELRKAHRFWGPKKLQRLLSNEFGKKEAPSTRTIARVLKRVGAPPIRRPALPRSKHVERAGGPLKADVPNQLWTFDFKGWWKTKDGRRFEPLTVRDAASRYVLLCVHCPETVSAVRRYSEELFRQYGLPEKIRSDNGPPFGADNALGGLTRLSAWWTSLGIEVDFSRPATPSDNGAHERLHGDVAVQLSAEPASDAATQQHLVDQWVREFNHLRPHEALNQDTPASHYRRSKRRMKTLTPQYPPDATRLRVNMRGRITLEGNAYFVGTGLAGQHIALRVRRDGEKEILFFNKVLGLLTSKPQRKR